MSCLIIKPIDRISEIFFTHRSAAEYQQENLVLTILNPFLCQPFIHPNSPYVSLTFRLIKMKRKNLYIQILTKKDYCYITNLWQMSNSENNPSPQSTMNHKTQISSPKRLNIVSTYLSKLAIEFLPNKKFKKQLMLQYFLFSPFKDIFEN